MNNQIILFGKVITLLLWGLVALSLLGFVPFPLHQIITYFGALVFVVHLGEIGFLMTQHRNKVRSTFSDCLSVLLFGVFSLQPLISRPSQESI